MIGVNKLFKKVCAIFLSFVIAFGFTLSSSLESYAYSRQKLNKSMQETQRLLTEGKTLQEIAEQRKIKLSTIHDHLLELAIQGQLQASVYLEKEAILQNLAQTEQDPRLWVYRDWRAQEATLSYLDFRLYQIQQIWQEKE